MRKYWLLFFLILIITVFFGIRASAATKVACTKITRTLKYGSQDTKANTDVAKLQRFLKSQGYYTGSIGGGLGNKTKQALQKFQVASGLYVDGVSNKRNYGVVDSKTRYQIQQLTCVKPSIVVTQPNSYAAFGLGETKTITWTTNTLSPINIYLRDRSRSDSVPTDTIIAMNVAGKTGSYTWTIPSNIVPGNRYTILISGSGVSDESDTYFVIQALVRGGGSGSGGGSCPSYFWFDNQHPDCSINGDKNFCGGLPSDAGFTSADTLASCQAKQPAAINVTLSSGQSSVQQGIPLIIRWGDRATSTKYDINLIANNGYSQNIKTSVNPSAYSWTVGATNLDTVTNPQIPKVEDIGRYNIQVCRHGSSVCGVSPDLVVGSSRKILAPGSGRSFLGGDEIDLDWSNNVSGELAGAKATLYRGSTPQSDQSVSAVGDGKRASWVVPLSQPAGSDYLFRVVGRNFPYSFYDSYAFSIGVTGNGGSILVNPNQAAATRGSSQSITWRDSSAVNTYNIYLRSYNNTTEYPLALNTALAANSAGLHAYSWFVGRDANNNPIPDGQYHFSVCHVNEANKCGESASGANTEFALASNNSYIQLPILSAACGGVSCDDAGNGHPITHARPAEASERFYQACTSYNASSPYFQNGSVVADLSSSQALSQVNIDFKQTGADGPAQAPCSYTLETSTNGESWTNLSGNGVSGSCSVANQLADIDVGAGSRQARYVRLSYSMPVGTCLALNKFNILEASGVSIKNSSNLLASVSQVINRLVNIFK